jgi:GNAT superfamily N-acetyltransferase
MECRKAITKADIEFCKEAILEFRPNLDPETVVDQVFQMINQEGFELVFLPNADNTKAGAFIGYRKLNMLRTGPMIYVDDLFTFPECRNQGFAGTLLDYVTHHATDEGIQSIHLDSGYTLHPAHRLYLNKGYYLACNHFAKAIN